MRFYYRTAIILSLLLGLCAVEAEAQRISVQVTVRSYHFNRSKDWNEWNLGAGLSTGYNNYGLEAGAYYNSIRKISPYAVASFSTDRDDNFGLIGAIGAVSGYGDGITPMLTGGIFIGRQPRLRISFLPNDNGDIIFAQISYTLQDE